MDTLKFNLPWSVIPEIFTPQKLSKRGLISVKGCCAIILIFLYSVPLYASEVMPFTAECVEGETHRYDGGNGKDMMGKKSTIHAMAGLLKSGET